jgi:hypothetical protein
MTILQCLCLIKMYNVTLNLDKFLGTYILSFHVILLLCVVQNNFFYFIPGVNGLAGVRCYLWKFIHPEAQYTKITNNTLAKRKGTKMIYKTLRRKLKIEQRESRLNRRMHQNGTFVFRLVASHRQTSSHNVVSSTPRHEWGSNMLAIP